MGIYEQIVWMTLIVVFIVDLSGFTQSWKGWLSRRTRYQIGSAKPFDCSLCLVWWCGLAMVIVDGFNLRTLAFVAGCSLATKVVAAIGQMVLDGLMGLIDLIYKLTKI